MFSPHRILLWYFPHHLFNTSTSEFNQIVKKLLKKKKKNKKKKGKYWGKFDQKGKMKKKEQEKKKWMCWSNTGTQRSCDAIMWPKLTCPTRFRYTRLNRRSLGSHRTPSIELLRISTATTAFSVSFQLFKTSLYSSSSTSSSCSSSSSSSWRRKRRRRWRPKLVTCNTRSQQHKRQLMGEG